MTASGVKEWIHNGMRHSFASYLLAATKNSALVSLIDREDCATVIDRVRRFGEPRQCETQERGKARCSCLHRAWGFESPGEDPVRGAGGFMPKC